jgi:hypothetical protein
MRDPVWQTATESDIIDMHDIAKRLPPPIHSCSLTIA